MPLTVHALDHLVINVAEVEASVAWYQRVLGVRREDFDPGRNQPKRTAILFGSQKINLRPVAASMEDWFTGARPQPGSDDLCFLTDASPEAAVAHLNELGIAIEEGPTIKQGAHGPIRSVYCRDPDGNLIEIASYGDLSGIKKSKNLTRETIIVECEVREGADWVLTNIEDALIYRDREMRCPACHGRMRPHKEYSDGARAHFEHFEAFAGCSMRSGAPSQLHPHALS